MEATTPCCRFCFITLALPALCQTLLSFTLTGSVANNNRVNLRGETCIGDIDDNMFNSGVSKGNVILWKSRSALLPSFREVINVRTFTCPEKVFPSAHWRIPRRLPSESDSPNSSVCKVKQVRMGHTAISDFL